MGQTRTRGQWLIIARLQSCPFTCQASRRLPGSDARLIRHVVRAGGPYEAEIVKRAKTDPFFQGGNFFVRSCILTDLIRLYRFEHRYGTI